MPITPLKHKCLNIILVWVIVHHKCSGLKKKVKTFFLLYLGKMDMVLGKKVAIFDWEWGLNSTPREGQKIL